MFFCLACCHKQGTDSVLYCVLHDHSLSHWQIIDLESCFFSVSENCSVLSETSESRVPSYPPFIASSSFRIVELKNSLPSEQPLHYPDFPSLPRQHQYDFLFWKIRDSMQHSCLIKNWKHMLLPFPKQLPRIVQVIDQTVGFLKKITFRWWYRDGEGLASLLVCLLLYILERRRKKNHPNNIALLMLKILIFCVLILVYVAILF